MATSMASSSLFLIHHAPGNNSINKHKTSKRVLIMLAKRDSSSHNNPSSSLIQVGSPIIKIQKVFEDKSRGIVCYMDDKGEITCEGFDEGPRLHHQAANSRFSSYQRVDQDIIDLLKRSLLQVTDGGKVN